MAQQPELSVFGNFLRVLEIDAAQAARCPDAFDRMRNGDLAAVLVHNLYDSATVRRLVARLERHDPPFVKTWFPREFRSWFFGRNLNLSHPDLKEYFADAPEFERHLAELFPEPLGPATRVAGVLSRLDGGRPVRAAPGPGPGQRYMFTTIRAHLEDGFIPPHCDNEQALRPSYGHLLGQIEPHIMSFVLCLAAAERGGAHEVYDLRAAPLATYLSNDDRSPHRWNVEGLRSAAIRIPAGGMLVVDSGRYVHRVSPVEGAAKRWTACSFMARSRRGDAIYCWG